MSLRIPIEIRGRKSAKKSPINTPSHKTTNRFQHLASKDIEEPDGEEDDNEATEDIGDILERGNDDPSDTRFKYENNGKYDQKLDSSDAAFKVYCFFQNLHKIQDFLGETWRLYKGEEIGLITASFTTNAAMDIVEREEGKLSSKVFPNEVNVS